MLWDPAVSLGYISCRYNDTIAPVANEQKKSVLDGKYVQTVSNNYCINRPLQVFDASARHLDGWVIESLNLLPPWVVENICLGIGWDVGDDLHGSLVGDVLVPLPFLGSSWVVLLLWMGCLRDGCWHWLRVLCQMLWQLLLILNHLLLLLNGRRVL